MKTVYDLSLHTEHIRHVQHASLNLAHCGLKITHGLFGSEEWFSKIASGALPLIRLRGVITRVYMASMNDWPEFEMRTDEDGSLSCWTRDVSDREDFKLYQATEWSSITFSKSGRTEMSCSAPIRSVWLPFELAIV